MHLPMRMHMHMHCGRLVFIGSDCPELPPSELQAALHTCRQPHAAHLCPADDGGYVLLGLPRDLYAADTARASLFEGVRWSSSDTCSSQAKALARAGLRAVVVGPTYHDCDELEDVLGLEVRLRAAPAPSRCANVGAWLHGLRQVLE